MAGWHSLSGYLHYKTGNNALGRLITRRKVWCVLEESQCQLHHYKSEEDFHRQKGSQGHIDLNGAAITLDLEHQNQFIVLSQAKEHIFTAENHESMMIWLLGLQAKRDLHSRKKTSFEEDNSQAKQQIPKDHNLWHSRPSLFMPPEHEHLPGHCEGHSSAMTCQGSLSSKGSKDFQWGSYGLHKWGESVDSGLTVYKRSLEASKSFPEQSYMEKKRLQRTKGLSYSHALLYHDMSDSDDVFGVDPPSSSPRKTSVSNWKKLQAVVMGQTRHDSCHPLESISNESAERNSVSSRSVSSDSAIERGEGTPQEVSARLTELERDLMHMETLYSSTKCELAKVMNRQTCYQEMLIQKDDTIRELEEQSGSSSDGKEEKKKRSQKKDAKAEKEFQEKIRVLQNQNRFLNEEVKKLAKIRVQEHGKFQEQNVHLSTLEGEIEKWKMDYVCLIQSSIRYPGEEGIDDLELCLYGGDKHKKRVQALLEEARKINPRLPTYESLANNEVHVDVYGFKHVYTNTGLLLHYLCTELTYHYLVQAGVYEEHQKHWTMFMRQHGKEPMKRVTELKCLCRGGIPDRFRRQVWRQMVHHKVKDIMKLKGDYYYRNLCNMFPESPLAACYRKQISLDLMRTLPNNIKFSSAGSKGIMDLQDVLLAFCVHNPSVGYCQGMNFIVGMSLIFLEAEDAFWTLVAIAERYFSPHYFDHSLIGAQADQQILKDMVKEKLPALFEHLECIDIELSTITLNWFLAVFFDAVPFQTLLRIWDCFLLEGPKVLFRFSLAILKLHEKDILQKTDTMGIMKHLKACAKLSYDVEGIVQLAFNEFKPFPKRRDIISKETCYLNILKEKHKKKELQRLAFAEREQLYMNMEAEAGTFMGIECAVAMSDGNVWFCYGDQHVGKLCYVSCDLNTMCSSDYMLDSRLMCMCTMGVDKLVLGTISWMLVAMDIVKQEQVWQIQLHDAILSVCCYEDEEAMATRIFAGLADGTVAVTEKPHMKKEPCVDVMYIPIGQAPVTCLMLLGEQVWSASGNTVAVIHAKTLDTMDTFSVSVNPYDHILSLVPSEFGIWISLRGSSILELWDAKTLNCRMLYDTRTDRYPHLRKEDDAYFNRARITSTLVNGNRVWVGTGEGNMIIYEIVESTQLKTPTDHTPSEETNSTMSFLARPERKKGLSGSEITITLQSLCDLKRDSGNISGDSLEVHPEDEDDKHYSGDTIKPKGWAIGPKNREHSISVTKDTKQGKPGKLRRRSSSENDMGILQTTRYAQKSTKTEHHQYSTEEGDNCHNLSVKTMVSKKNCSENDLQKLGEERASFDDSNFDGDDDELEQELEAVARRESLSMLMEAEEEVASQSRRQSVCSLSGKEQVPCRRSSQDVTTRGKFSLIDVQQKLENYKSDDSGCETRSGPRRKRFSSSSSRRSSYSKKDGVIASGAEMEENVFEAELEQRARRESLVVFDTGDVSCKNSEEKDYASTGKPTGVKQFIATQSSMDSDSSASVELGNSRGQAQGQEGEVCDDVKLLPVIPLDDSYLSSSPCMSVTQSPTPKLDSDNKTTILGLSIDSVEEEAIKKSRSENAMFGSTDMPPILQEPRKRKTSVIEDMSVMCSDCRALNQKCADCKLLLTGQELLKLNERRMSLVEPTGDIPIELIQDLNKLNGIIRVSHSENNVTCLSKPQAPDSPITPETPDYNNSVANSSIVISQPQSDDSRVNHLNVVSALYPPQQNTRRKRESYRSHSQTQSSGESNALSMVCNRSTEYSGRESDSKIEKHEKIFPQEPRRKDLSRREKVGYWLSSISATQDYSIDKDEITDSQKAISTVDSRESRRCITESEEEVFYETVDKAEAGADRPKTLNLGNRKSKYFGGKLDKQKHFSTDSIGSDASSGMTKKSTTTMPDMAVSHKDPGAQYRLDFTNVTVETDVESEIEPTTPVNNLQSCARNPDARKNSLDLGIIQEKCSQLESDTQKCEKENKDLLQVKVTERQRIFEFLKTPSLASRHMSLGLKIIEDDMEWTELYGGAANHSTPSPNGCADQRLADFLRTPSISSKPSSLWSSYENISTPSNIEPQEAKLLLPTRCPLSHSASSASIGSDNDLLYNVDLSLEAKVKISDKPVKCLLATCCNNEPILLSFSGSHGDDEAVLKWRKHQNEDLWTNEPVMEICPKTKQTILPTYMRQRFSSNSSASFESNASSSFQKH